MSTYGDRGNVITLFYRAKQRDININIIKVSVTQNVDLLSQADLIFMGGAQDKQQEIVNQDLKSNKGNILKKIVEKGIPGLYVCGAYQFLGRYYKAADGKLIDGLSIFDLYTESPGINSSRLIGNLLIESDVFNNTKLIGFENHTGRTYLGEKVKPFAKVIKGFGNNGKDMTEGVIFKNSIGTYMHGPILPKNPELADWIIIKALEFKYGKKIPLNKIDDKLEKKARSFLIGRL